jgi:hypothetical protein
MLSDETRKLLSEIDSEIRLHDPVASNFQYRAFVSRSKGIRNGKRRIRKHWKDIELVKYQDGNFHQWHRFPFDETVTEALPGWDEWKAIEYLQDALRGGVLVVC